MKKVFTDLYCEKCGFELIDEFIEEDYEKSSNKVRCSKCGDEMKQRIGFGSFKLVFNQKSDLCDWSGNHNKYWDAVKQARSEGKKVKGCNEN